MRTLLYTPPQSPAKARSLQRIFNHCGIHTDACDDADRFLYLSMTERYTAAVIQAPLEHDDLLALHSEWKQSGGSGLFVVVSPIQSALKRGQALAAGIDRYYLEPYSHTALVKEIALHAYSLAGTETSVHATKHFEIDVLHRTITFEGEPLNFTKTEFELFSLLLRKKGTALSRIQIWEEIWGYEEYPLANTIDVHLNRLRKKLPPAARKYLGTIYGVGYRVSGEA